MNKSLAHLLVAFLLLCAQALAAVHALEHATAEREGVPPHVCELCLAAHDLNTPIGSSVVDLPVIRGEVFFIAIHAAGRSALPPPLARQQAPPYL